MTDNPRVRSIWYQPPSEGVQECIGLEVGVPKRFLRIWPAEPHWPLRTADYGHTMHESARIVWGADAGAGMAARVGELLDLHLRPYQIDHLRAYLAARDEPADSREPDDEDRAELADLLGADMVRKLLAEHPTPPNRNPRCCCPDLQRESYSLTCPACPEHGVKELHHNHDKEL